MTASTDIQFICSDNYNAPSLSNAWGVMINVLDGCLVNGLGLPAIVNAIGNGTQVTITFNANHQLKMFQVLRLTGFSPASLNADFRIIGVPSTSTVVIESSEQNIITIGTAILKPLGYEKSFSGVNKAVYRDKNTNALNRPFLRVDNSLDPVYSESYAKFAKVGVLESCSGIDDILVAQIPFEANNPTKNWIGTGTGANAYAGWAKWYYARASNAYNGSPDTSSPQNGNRPWMIVGNGQGFYVVNPMTPSDEYKLLYGFGVYELVDGVNTTPYYLLATWDYEMVGTSRDFSGGLLNTAPFYSDRNPAILFDGVGVKSQVSALPAHSLYNSGIANTYANNFACMPYVLVANSYLMGTLPCLRHLNKTRSDNQFTSVAYSNTMYVIDLQMNNRRIAFNLGSM